MKVAVRSLIVSAIGIVAPSFFSYLSCADGKANAVKSKKQGDAFEKITKDLMTALHEDRVTLIKALVDMKSTVPVGKK